MFDTILDVVWRPFLSFLETALTLLHGVLEPAFGTEAAWGWAVIALTLIVRTLLTPLAIKQIRSMKGMQEIQPKVKEIQEKYKVDRDLMKKDPERYQKLKQKQNEKLMALYKEEGVNPASSCLPLLLQMPIFFALFDVLRSGDRLPEMAQANFYFFTQNVEGLGGTVGSAGWPGWLLILMMAGSMFLTQRQMMSRNNAEGAQATQQKIMMYVFPVFLSGISISFPLAVVLYWVTTNIWQFFQQYALFRTVADEEQPPEPAKGKRHADENPDVSGNGSSAAKKQAAKKQDTKTQDTKKQASGAATNGKKPSAGTSSEDDGQGAPSKKKSTSSRSASHLPSRRN